MVHLCNAVSTIYVYLGCADDPGEQKALHFWLDIFRYLLNLLATLDIDQSVTVTDIFVEVFNCRFIYTTHSKSRTRILVLLLAYYDLLIFRRSVRHQSRSF